MASLTSHPLFQARKNEKTKKAEQEPFNIDMREVASIILGGGEGSRLFPLTLTCCKPAIWFGGSYRLIDVPISNSLNSDCRKIFIITQFLSTVLHRHIFNTYPSNHFSSGFIDILAAEQKPSKSSWYQGTADAVRQNLDYFIQTPVEYFLILSGDQLYNFNFQKLMRFMKNSGAEAVISCLPVNAEDAKRMGVMKIDDKYQIIDFYEKPQDPHILEDLRTPETVLNTMNAGVGKHYIGSMGIYLFKKKMLIDLLKQDLRDDFGKHLIPAIVKKGNTAAYVFDGYWEDIGTIDSFYKANINLTKPNSAFDYYDENNPIFSSRKELPPPKLLSSNIYQSIICEGSFVEADEISNSILGARTVVRRGTKITDSYIMGNDFYTPPVTDAEAFPQKLEIGQNCIIHKTIIDKNVFIGKNVRLINKNNLTHYDGENIYIRDGIIVVPRGTTIPDGFSL